jgi:hypothetical protein
MMGSHWAARSIHVIAKSNMIFNTVFILYHLKWKEVNGPPSMVIKL